MLDFLSHGSPLVDTLGLSPEEITALIDNPGVVVGRDSSGTPEVFVPRASHPINQDTRSDLTPTIRTPEGRPVAQSKVKGPSPDFAVQLGRKALQERASQLKQEQERVSEAKRLQPAALMARIEFLERSLRRLQKQVGTSSSTDSLKS